MMKCGKRIHLTHNIFLDRQVEWVRLSCQLSIVEGYPDNSLWCQEIIEEEEAN